MASRVLNTKPKIDGVVENIFNPDPDIVPNPTTLGDGQIAVNTSDTKPRLFIKKADGSLATFEDVTAIQQRVNAGGSTLSAHISDKNNPHTVTAFQVGLGNVDNTSDANKPISTATQTALNSKVDKVSGKGLSTNDFTTAEKTKLSGIETGAQVNNIEVKLGSVHDDIAPIVVDNVLNINSGNPIANKPVAVKFDSIDSNIAQLEQDVSVMRGDVQGVSFTSNITTATTIDLTKAFTLSAYLTITDVATPSDPEAIIAQASSMYDSTFNGLAIYRYVNNLLRVRYGMDSSSVYHAIGVAIYHNKPIKIDITYDGVSTANIYLNGQLVQTATNIITTGITTTPIVLNKGIIRGLRIYNAALTQQQIDYSYNQGRCDEVVLGDEWRGELSHNHIISYPNGYNTDGNYIVVDRPIGGAVQLIRILNIEKGIYRLNFSDFSTIVGYYLSNCEVIEDNKKGEITILYDGGPNIEMKPSSEGSSFKYTSVILSKVYILNEYLPQYLTQTKWIDTGVNKQDITLTAPQFTYIRPYKQHLFGSGAPSTPPDAAFVEYSDTATGNIWKGGTKPNTRQFEVSDWKQINN